MPPAEFYIRLQHGITGGFAPATPSAIHTLSRAGNSPAEVVVSSAVRPQGQPSLAGFTSRKIPVEPHAALLKELYLILKEIPTESPPGSEDIYGFDTSIAWGSVDLEWCNGGPAGCSGGNSTTKASDQDKKKFQRAIEIVNELVK